MRLLGSLLAIGVILLNMALGARGFLREGKDFFTMKPFSGPIVQCHTFVESAGKPVPFPENAYEDMPKAEFTARVYLETLPLYVRGLAALLRPRHPDVSVRMLCRAVHGTDGALYVFSSDA